MKTDVVIDNVTRYHAAVFPLRSHGILRILYLQVFLSECDRIAPHWRSRRGEDDAVIG